MKTEIKGKRVVVTGGEGFLGRYVVDELLKLKPGSLIVPSHKKYDLRNRRDCDQVLRGADIVIHLAAQIGGIGFINEIPGEIFYNNLIMGVELMEAARKVKVKKFVSIGTVCEYPRETPIPFKEENLWEGYPEEVTSPYGWAKKILIVQSDSYRKQYNFNSIHLLPVNLYGPGDNFDKRLSHVIPALIKRFVKARENKEKKVVVWGSGKATREFLFVRDAARGIVLATQKYDSSLPLNLGTGVEVSIAKVAEIIKKLTKYEGEIVWDGSMPDGQPRRRLDISKALKLGYKVETDLLSGLKETVEWYEKNRK